MKMADVNELQILVIHTHKQSQCVSVIHDGSLIDHCCDVDSVHLNDKLLSQQKPEFDM